MVACCWRGYSCSRWRCAAEAAGGFGEGGFDSSTVWHTLKAQSARVLQQMLLLGCNSQASRMHDCCKRSLKWVAKSVDYICGCVQCVHS
jgi:hypothetical protein